MSKRSAQRNRWRNRPKKPPEIDLIFGGMDLGQVSHVFTTFSVDCELLYKQIEEVFAIPVFHLGKMAFEFKINTGDVLSQLRKAQEKNAFVYGNKHRHDGPDIRVTGPLQIEEVTCSVINVKSLENTNSKPTK